MDKQEKNQEQFELQEELLDTELEDTADGEEEEEQDETIVNSVYDWARSLVSAVVGVVLLFTFVLRLIGVSGSSMENTFYTGDRVVILNSVFCDYQPGDVVVADAYNAVLNETIVKRIIATGGQTVDIDFYRGIVYVDGVALDEPYVKEPTYTNGGLQYPITLAEDEVFLMGDNRNASTDSRSYMLGPVKEGYLQGKVVFLLFPGKTSGIEKRELSRIGFVD